MLKAPMFFIAASDLGLAPIDPNDGFARRAGEGRRMSASCSPKAVGARRKPNPTR